MGQEYIKITTTPSHNNRQAIRILIDEKPPVLVDRSNEIGTSSDCLAQISLEHLMLWGISRAELGNSTRNKVTLWLGV
ncbi:hypothetical protein CDAR_209311 [Caerostris darwini]|uniref:Uncharacterized protein n=1 Tax=Caerostris darwini TaxID=1538125 RepID=A0AAV4X4H1_9ARAC|nr:hypothetical protein CDAR_209311 [Caerostris darwini]